MTISTGIVGFTAYYCRGSLTNLVPNQIGLDATVLIFGIFSGAIWRPLRARVWNRYLKSRF